jgi:hypothetical protein
LPASLPDSMAQLVKNLKPQNAFRSLFGAAAGAPHCPPQLYVRRHRQ